MEQHSNQVSHTGQGLCRDFKTILKLHDKCYNKVINQVPYGSWEEGVGLTLLREIKESFMEEVTS